MQRTQQISDKRKIRHRTDAVVAIVLESILIVIDWFLIYLALSLSTKLMIANFIFCIIVVTILFISFVYSCSQIFKAINWLRDTFREKNINNTGLKK
jgi:hypothetical protein